MEMESFIQPLPKYFLWRHFSSKSLPSIHQPKASGAPDPIIENYREFLENHHLEVLVFCGKRFKVKADQDHDLWKIFLNFPKHVAPSVQFSRSVVPDSLQPHESQHACYLFKYYFIIFQPSDSLLPCTLELFTASHIF